MAGEKAPKRELIALVGPAAFYIGLVIALIAAFVIEASSWLYVVLGALGVIVGLLNITTRETSKFLLATIAFIIAASAMYSLMVLAFGAAPPAILTKELLLLATNLTVLIGASAMVVSLKAIYQAGKGR